MSKEYNKFAEHAFVTVKDPEGQWSLEWFGHPIAIILHVGQYVWVEGDYSMLESGSPVVQVGDGRSNGFDEDGNCILSIPAAWCTYYTSEEAESIMKCIDADEQLLRYAQ